MPIYEMIETVILCYLGSGCMTGTYGSVVRSVNGIFTVSAEGRTFTARTTVIGWAVTAGALTGEDADLIEAARLAVMP